MPSIVPEKRPSRTRPEVERALAAIGHTEMPCIVAFRGYREFGEGNERGIYDDACFVMSATGTFKSFNFNTDPSVTRPGVATLRPGTYRYQKGNHPLVGGYPALRQAEPVDVDRDGQAKKRGRFLGWFGINIHMGSRTKTSSLGCQTVYPAQWHEFITLVYLLMDKFGRKSIPYVLIDES